MALGLNVKVNPFKANLAPFIVVPSEVKFILYMQDFVLYRQ